MATANSSGAKQGSTRSYGPFGEAVDDVPDNSDGKFDYGWLGSLQRPVETEAGVSTIQMGARPYVAGLGRFLEVDPVDGGSCSDYDYACANPVNGFDLGGTHYYCPGDSCEGNSTKFAFVYFARHRFSNGKRTIQFSPKQVAGMVGNLLVESGMRRKISCVNGGKGIACWISSRWNGLVSYANYFGYSPYDLEIQLRYIVYELMTYSYFGLDALLRTKTVESAARVFMEKYLRPGIQHWDRRRHNALECYSNARGYCPR